MFRFMFEIPFENGYPYIYERWFGFVGIFREINSRRLAKFV